MENRDNVTSEITYIGENGELVENAQEAKWAMVREYKDGKMIRETIAATGSASDGH